MKSIKQCYTENSEVCSGLRECHKQAKEDGLSRVEALESCVCEPCADLVAQVTSCISENCVPTCVQETSRAYFKCTANPLHQCKESCEATVEDIKTEILANYEDEDVKLRNALFNLEVVQKVQEADMELNCANIEAKFYETPACTLGNCCPSCVDEFEDMASCAVNTAVAFEENEANGTADGDEGATDAEDIGCVFDCGDNIEIVTEDGDDGEGDATAQTRGGSRRRVAAAARVLQESDVAVPEVVENKFSMCSDSMSKTLAVGESATAADNFLNCAIEASLPNLPGGDEGDDTDEESSRAAASIPGFAGVVLFVATMLNMLL